MKNTNDTQKHPRDENVKNEKMSFQSLGNICLMIIAVLIIGNAILIYYLINSQEYENKMLNAVEQTNTASEEKEDTVANILNTVVSNQVSGSQTTVNATDTNNRKVLNENLIVLYDGLILDTTKMDLVNLKYIDNTSTDKDKYVITYYNYENFEYTGSTLGKLSEQIYENLIRIDNVGKISISEEYNAIPKDIKIVNTIPNIILDNNSKLSEYDQVKTIIADLDSNGMDEYITILANKKTGFSKISLYDGTGKLVDDLAYIEKSKWYQNDMNGEFYFSLDCVNVIDVDNDGIMEILVDIPKYEGESSVSILKYKNSKLEGKTNIECSLLP